MGKKDISGPRIAWVNWKTGTATDADHSSRKPTGTERFYHESVFWEKMDEIDTLMKKIIKLEKAKK